jgi:hypothetical protein
MYLYFGMGIDSPMQISTCGKQFMDAKIYNYKGSYILGTFEEKKRDQCLNLHRWILLYSTPTIFGRVAYFITHHSHAL